MKRWIAALLTFAILFLTSCRELNEYEDPYHEAEDGVVFRVNHSTAEFIRTDDPIETLKEVGIIDVNCDEREYGKYGGTRCACKIRIDSVRLARLDYVWYGAESNEPKPYRCSEVQYLLLCEAEILSVINGIIPEGVQSVLIYCSCEDIPGEKLVKPEPGKEYYVWIGRFSTREYDSRIIQFGAYMNSLRHFHVDNGFHLICSTRRMMPVTDEKTVCFQEELCEIVDMEMLPISSEPFESSRIGCMELPENDFLIMYKKFLNDIKWDSLLGFY